MNASRRTGLFLALATALISGVSVYLNSYGVKAFGSSTTYTTAKNLVATVLLLGIAALVVGGGRARRPVLARPRGVGAWVGIAFVGLFGGATAFVLFFEGLSRASSVHAAFLHKTLLVWVALLAVPLLHERVGGWHVAAIALLVVGQVGLAGGMSATFGGGEWMVLAATLVWAVEVVVAKWLLSDLSSWTVGLARMGVGSLALVTWALVRGQAGALVRLDAAQWRWVLLTGLLLAGYVSTWFAALARAQAVDVTAVLVLAAIITAVVAAVAQGASLLPQAGWLVLVAAGGALVAVPMWRGGRPAGAVAPVRDRAS